MLMQHAHAHPTTPAYFDAHAKVVHSRPWMCMHAVTCLIISQCDWTGVRTLEHGLQLRLVADGGPSEGRAGRADGDGRDGAVLTGGSAPIREELAKSVPAVSHLAGTTAKTAYPHLIHVLHSLIASSSGEWAGACSTLFSHSLRL